VVKSLDRSHEELPGVVGAERSEGDGGNWGGPPGLSGCESADRTVPITGDEPGNGGSPEASEAVIVPIEPDGQHTTGDGKAAASSMCAQGKAGECLRGWIHR